MPLVLLAHRVPALDDLPFYPFERCQSELRGIDGLFGLPLDSCPGSLLLFGPPSRVDPLE